MEERELPAGWEIVDLGQIATVLSGNGFPKEHQGRTSGDLGFFKVSDISRSIADGQSSLRDARNYISVELAARLKATIIPCGSTVFAKIGEAISLNRRAITEFPCIVDNNVMAVKAVGEIFDKYVFYFLRSQDLRELSRATTVPSLRKSDISDLQFPVPPLNEQRRIAAKLDTTLAAVDSCRQRLDGVAELLKRFRQAVLAAATSGELTRDWREERGMADSWRIVSLSEVADSRLGKMLDQSKNTGQLTPYLRNINVRWFSFDLEDIQQIRLGDKEIAELDVRFGDLLICEGGEPGRCAVWRGENSRYTFQKALHRVRTSRYLLADYLSYCLCNSANNGRLAELFTGTTIKHLTGASLKKFKISLPSREEQEEIIDRVETFFTLADQLEARLTSARKVVDRLTPALLAKAFRGELVPQDPSDEPASALLERIRAARQAEVAAGKPARRGRKKAAAHPDPTSLGLDSKPAAVASDPMPPDQLATLLQECGPLSEKALLAASELEPGRFLRQLQLELQAGTIREDLEEGERVLVGG